MADDALPPGYRPPGGWSAVAEDWTDLRHLGSWRTYSEVQRQRRRAASAEQDADMLYACLEGERAMRRAER